MDGVLILIPLLFKIHCHHMILILGQFYLHQHHFVQTTLKLINYHGSKRLQSRRNRQRQRRTK